METLLLILLCLAVAIAAEFYLAKGRCIHQHSRFPEDIQ